MRVYSVLDFGQSCTVPMIIRLSRHSLPAIHSSENWLGRVNKSLCGMPYYRGPVKM